MSEAELSQWREANKRYLTACIARVRGALERAAERAESGGASEASAEREGDDAEDPGVLAARSEMQQPPALERLVDLFGLTPFERSVLLLCAGVELVSSLGSLCAAAHGDARRGYPTFSLALSSLGRAHWSALSPARPLRRWRLVEVQPAGSLTLSALRVDESVLHYLAGVHCLDDRLAGYVEPLDGARELSPSHAALAARVASCWSWVAPPAASTVVELCGGSSASKRDIAAAACDLVGLDAFVIRGADIPSSVGDRELLSTLWERQAALSRAALIIDCDDLEGHDRLHTLRSFLRNIGSVVAMTTTDPMTLRGRSSVRVEVTPPTPSEQLAMLQAGLGDDAGRLDGDLHAATTQFRLDVEQIRSAVDEVRTQVANDGASSGAHALWDVLRARTRGRLDDIAQRIPPMASWDELVLPAAQVETLREVAAHVRHRTKVYETWGFGLKSNRGLGISALFAGPSGTGKTMAAEVLANELRLDLYRIDLSQVVSKYIGETEKNLRRAFDAADEGGAILLFDEADALFGKRSEVKDSHDRYANIEVSYLLQRMEAYRGLAILTTNLKQALDQAFLRRLRFTVQFPFPDATHRAEIWRRVFPSATPTEGLDYARLAQLNTAGGNIRNIAMNAAFLAAESGQVVRMEHVLRAARTEYAKLEKPLTTAEIGGWT